MTRLLMPALLAILVLGGCGDAGDDQATPQTSADRGERGVDNAFLGMVDAETPYLYANLQRLPENVIDKIWAINEATASGNLAVLEAVAEDDETPQPLRALLEELKTLSTREGWEAAGLHSNPLYAVHAVSLFPYAHLELSDGRAFGDLIERVEARLQVPLQRRDIAGAEVLWIEIGAGFGLAMRHDQRMVTLALIPDEALLLARVAGQADPLDPLDAGILAALNAESGLSAFGSGYLDWRRVIAEAFDVNSLLTTVDRDGMLAALRDEAACAVEFRALTTALPRMVFGYTRINEGRIDFLARQETSDAIGQGLAPIARAPVSLDRELSGLLSLGLAYDLVAGREFARSIVDGWVENPPMCSAFAEIAARAPAMQQGLNRPIPPIVTNLHGMFLQARELELGASGIPTGGGTLSVFMKNPQLLVGMAQMFSPAVAQLQLEPGGEPREVPDEALPQLQNMDLDAWIAMGEDALGVAIGEDYVDELTAQIEATDADDLLFSSQWDYDILTRMLDMAEQTLEDDKASVMLDDDEARVMDAQRRQYEALADVYDSGAVRVRLTEQGVDLIAETKMK